jgi:hypothetical protein
VHFGIGDLVQPLTYSESFKISKLAEAGSFFHIGLRIEAAIVTADLGLRKPYRAFTIPEKVFLEERPRIDLDEIAELIDISGNNIKVFTLAPELDGAMEAIEYLKGQCITVSTGHSEAGYNTMREAANKGLSHITHLFNGMPVQVSATMGCPWAHCR